METDAATAVEALIHDYSKLVFHVIYGLTGNFQESEDLTQDTFLQAFRKIDAARAASGPHFQGKAWLLKIAVNTARMALRRQRTMRFFTFSELGMRPNVTDHEVDVPSAVYEEIEDGSNLETMIAERDTVRACMEKVPETLRIPLLLSVVAGFSPSELARILALNEATARQRLSRGRKAFQRLYTEACGEHLAPGGSVSRSPQRVSRSRDHRMHRPAALLPAVAL